MQGQFPATPRALRPIPGEDILVGSLDLSVRRLWVAEIALSFDKTIAPRVRSIKIHSACLDGVFGTDDFQAVFANQAFDHSRSGT